MLHTYHFCIVSRTCLPHHVSCKWQHSWHEGEGSWEPYSALLHEPENDYEVDPKAEQLMSADNYHICF